ncbi:hypothetical protein V8D89_013012 [Ganoderma adspersum]
MDGHKRKRDDDGTVVTFYAPNRTFARVYKGQSLEETRGLVRRKLGLSEDTALRFARLHEGKVIELDDDEDFEAFRHLARHVHTLDVSVFVGQNGPSIFTQQFPRESSTNPKGSKNRPTNPSIVPVSPEAATRDVTSRKDQMSDPPYITSTLDVHGVPKKKRKRKGMSPPSELAVSSSVQPKDAPQVLPEGHEASRSSKKPLPQDTLFTVPSLPALQDTVPSKTGAPDLPKSSKRKRQDTPESPATSGSATAGAASLSTPSRPSTQPSPLKKKLRKEKRSEDATPSSFVEEQPIARPNKKGKRKADDAVSTPSEVTSAPAAISEDDVGARKAAKKSKKEMKERERQAVGTREELVLFKEDEKQSKKRKARDTEEAEVTDVEPSAIQVPSDVELAPKRDRRKHVEAPTESQTASVEVPVPVAPTDDTPAKGGKERKSKAKNCQSEQLTVELAENADEVEPSGSSLAEIQVDADGQARGTGTSIDLIIGVDAMDATEKKQRRRKTLSTASPDAKGAAHPADHASGTCRSLNYDISLCNVRHDFFLLDAPEEGLNSPSAKKSKGDRRKSLPADASSSEIAEITPSAGVSVVQDAVRAVLARVSSTNAGPVSIPPSQQPTPLTPDPAAPTRKRKAGKSKLSQTWGPNDLVEEQEQVSVSTVTLVAPSAAPVSSAIPTPETKKAKGKKVLRPSSAPICPVCDEASLHPRSQCPIVEAGPVAIRKRITQIKKSRGSEDLIEELEVLLKEAQRRRKSAGTKRAAEVVTAPVSVPALEVPVSVTPSSPDVPLQPVSTAAQLRPSLGDRSLSSRLPAGSEISEVAVQSRDEGSSNESASDDGDDEDARAPASSFLPPPSLSLLHPNNLEELLYGPVNPCTSILAQIPSSSSSSEGEESDDEVEKDEDVDMDEDEKNDRAFRRVSRKFARAVSSSDEDEPQPEPDQQPDLDGAEVDGEGPIVLPPEMGTDPSRSMDAQDAQQVEADVLLQDTSAIERSVEQSGEELHEFPENNCDPSKGENHVEDKASVPSEAESDEEMEPKAISQSDDQSSESEAVEPDISPADRGDDHNVEPGAEVDPLASQEHLEALVEVPEELEGPGGSADVDEEPEQHSADLDRADVSVEVSECLGEPAPKLRVDLPEVHPSNEDEGASPAEASANLSGTTAQAELEKVAAPFEGQDEGEATAEGNLDTMEVEVFEPHTEDPDDPIETFSSDHDQEQRDVLEEDPIEDPDMTQQGQRTPPPATPRTPGTVGRMKDRYGRLSQARTHQAIPRLSQQLLGDLALSQEEITLASLPTGGALEPSLELEVAPDVQTGAVGDVEVENEAVVEPAKTQEETLPSQSQSQPDQVAEAVEARPRRTIRTTVRHTSSTAPSSSLPEPQATPTPAPVPRRRGGRLTAEEKAQREAEKAQKDAEKKAERERKAAEKAAEKAAQKAAQKAAKEAEKKVERERKAAERQAEKDAKQAEKEAKQKEKAPTKRGRAARGRGGSTKPVSTRSQPAVEPIGPEEEGVDGPKPGEENGEEASVHANVTETPGVAKVSWAVLPQSGSRTQEGSVGETSMIDELQPSSPEATPHQALVESPALEDTVIQEPIEQENLPTVTPKPKGKKKDPLFIPSSSQHPVTPFGLPNAESTPFANNDGQNEGDSDRDAEPDRTFKAPTRPRASWVSQSLYPSLTDLASQSLFSTAGIPSPALFTQTPKQGTVYKLPSVTYGKGGDGDDDDDDDESSDDSNSSDSDSGKKKSHIPQNRRAGAGVQKKKSGLLSAYS